MKFSKRSLGQNFFINEHLGEKIIQTISEFNPNVIVEIGPGRGFFTGKLQSICEKLICIEKDNNLAGILSQQYPCISVYNEDFLKFDLKNLPKDTMFFGSLPYNVSKPIIKKILTSKNFTKPCFFIIQKEVADKYTAYAPNNNLLSLTAQIYAKPKKLLNINSGSFRPKPKVESSFIQFSPLENKNTFPLGFENFLNKAFSSPRKTLKNNLKTKSANPLLKKRPAELALEEYLILFNENLI
jgi:16S rRNA (adenine1518-N6/adenine1519-N6)-dimethyltransferase